jgi:hypothetical protein
MALILIEVDDERIERLNKIKNGPWGSKNLTNDELMILNGRVIQNGEWIDSSDPIQRNYDQKNFRKRCSICNNIGNKSDKFCSNCQSIMKIKEEE